MNRNFLAAPLPALPSCKAVSYASKISTFIWGGGVDFRKIKIEAFLRVGFCPNPTPQIPKPHLIPRISADQFYFEPK